MTAAARRMAQFGIGLRLADVPTSVVQSAKLHLLDTIGVGLAASTLPLSTEWADGVRAIGGSGGGQSTVFGRGAGLSATLAALANGALVHSLEFDDTHIGSVVHGGAVAAPTALAVAEECGADGPRLLTGFITAWEVMIRLGLAAPGAYQANGFQISAAGGAIGAAVAAGAIRQASEDTAVSAIGIAGSQASGLLEFLSDGSTVKALHPGWAAHTGIAAMALAGAGMTGPETVLEGRFGFLACFARDAQAAARLAGHLDSLGTLWHLPDAAFKLFPCCHYIHPFLEAMQVLIDGGLKLSEIGSVTCHVPPPQAPLICEPWERRQKPASGYDGKWGLAYCLAALLVDGRVDVASFARQPDPAVVETARMIAWAPMEDHNFPQRFEAVVEVLTRSGAVLRHRVNSVRGSRDRPIPEAEVMKKFHQNASLALGEADVEAVREAVLALDQSPDLSALTKPLRSAD